MSTNKDGNAQFGVLIYDPVRNQERIGFGELFQYRGDMAQGDAIKAFRNAKSRLPNSRVLLIQQIDG